MHIYTRPLPLTVRVSSIIFLTVAVSECGVDGGGLKYKYMNQKLLCSIYLTGLTRKKKTKKSVEASRMTTYLHKETNSLPGTFPPEEERVCLLPCHALGCSPMTRYK